MVVRYTVFLYTVYPHSDRLNNTLLAEIIILILQKSFPRRLRELDFFSSEIQGNSPDLFACFIFFRRITTMYDTGYNRIKLSQAKNI